MPAVTAQIVLRFAAAARGPETTAALLQRVGLSADLDPAAAIEQTVAADAYYDLLERAAGDDDDGLPLRYGASIRPEDFGAMGLALKTASTLHEALERLVRYVFVITDSLEYELGEDQAGWRLAMLGRPHERRGVALANEGALAAITSILRQITTAPVAPSSVCFRHPPPRTSSAHEQFFACPIRFGADVDALQFHADTLRARTRLGDEGLSAYFLAHLEHMRASRDERAFPARVHRAVLDTLCDGAPSRSRIARRLGMSESSLHRRLAEHGLSFRAIADRARRELAESLLRASGQTLAEVAFLTGFADQSAFARAFKRWSGQTPLEFRRAHGSTRQ